MNGRKCSRRAPLPALGSGLSAAADDTPLYIRICREVGWRLWTTGVPEDVLSALVPQVALFGDKPVRAVRALQRHTPPEVGCRRRLGLVSGR
jgi:hypothetical protein